MKILHTADWHLGVKTDDFDRMPEQIEALNKIINISRENEVDMVIIAGDIYENFVPSAMAEKLFYDTCVKLSRNGQCAVVVIAGNHDEPKRFSNANVFAARHNVYLIGAITDIVISPNRNWKIKPIESGKGYIKFSLDTGEIANVALLPYPSYYRYQEMKKDGDVFGEKVKEWFSYGKESFCDGEINIQVAHLLTYGINLNYIDFEKYEFISSSFPFIDQKYLHSKAVYTALGHMHQFICVNKEEGIYYSGSLINNHFINNDVSTCVILATVTENGIENLENVSLDTKTLILQNVYSLEEANAFCKVNQNKWVKLVLNEVHHINIEEVKKLKKDNPNLITLSIVSPSALIKKANLVSKKNLTNKEIFTTFIKEKTGEEPTQELLTLFLELMEEIVYETN